MAYRVLLDTCVLVPAALRDTLLRAAVRDLYELCWSAEILVELERVLVREGLTTSDRASYLVETLKANFPNAIVPDGYKRLIPVMENDEKDRHVLAATVFASARTIVTENIRHFPASALEPFEIEAQTPDAFLMNLFRSDPDDMCEIVIRQARALRYGNYTVSDVLDSLGHSAPQFAALTRKRMSELNHLAKQLEDLEHP